MIRLVYSNRTEELLAALAEVLRERRRRGQHPLDAVELVVPNRNLEQYVRLGLAEAMGVAAGLRFRRLERFLGELVAEVDPGARLVDAPALRAGLLALLHDDRALGDPALAPVRAYLDAAGRDPSGEDRVDGRDLRRVQLATRLGHLFEEYAYSRPEMLGAWPAGTTLDGDLRPLEAWQRALWLRVAGQGGLLPRHPPRSHREGARWIGLEEVAMQPLAAGPPIHVFGVSYVARLFQRLFARLGEVRDVWLFTLNPCQEFWEDLETEAELRRRLRRTFPAGTRPRRPADDPFGLFDDTDNLPLRRWGRPGREHVRLLDEVTECDFDARFVDPLARQPDSLLARLQSDVLARRESLPVDGDPSLADGSITFLACPDAQREAEAVADSIWQLMLAPPADGVPPLRFSDVAVIVNPAVRERVVPQLRAVLAEYHGIPCSLADQPLAEERRVAEAARLLLELPFGRFSRQEVLRVMLHPAVCGRFPDLDPTTWAELAQQLGIFHGATRADHAGTYVEEDLLSWEQGLRRLALGAFLAGGRSGEERPWEHAGRVHLPLEVPGSRLQDAARFGLLARSLLADARRIRDERQPLSTWAVTLRRLLATYLGAGPDAPSEEGGDLVRCLAALDELERADLAGTPVSGRVACELALGALAGLTAGQGAPLGEGVAVSSFLPMRAIPFRAVFVMGLGEGEFPTANRRDALDLRAAKRLPGDVSPAERDRYMFLETLLCARQRITLSWVARDELTGEELRPSSVVQELMRLLAASYVGEEGLRRLQPRVPLRRWEGPEGDAADEILPSHAPQARGEAAAQRLGRDLRAAFPALVVARDPVTLLRRELPPGSGATAVLALPTVDAAPVGEAPPTPGTLAVPLRALRKLLECPLQASASQLLGLRREDDGEDPAEAEEEPLRTSRLDTANLLREGLVAALRHGRPAGESYRRLARRQELAGVVPSGVLGEIERDLHVEALALWEAALADLRTSGPAERLRWGRVPEGEEVDAVYPPPTLLLPPAEPGGEAVLLGAAALPRPCEVRARSELLLARRRTTVIVDGGMPGSGTPGKVRRLRLALRGYFDHLLLAAADLMVDVPRELRLLARDEKKPSVRFALAPVSRQRATEILAGLASDLLSGLHPYLLPCEAVLDGVVRRGAAGLDDGAALVARVEELVAGGKGYTSAWGPVPEPWRWAPPEPATAARLARRRFAPFVELVQEVG